MGFLNGAGIAGGKIVAVKSGHPNVATKIGRRYTGKWQGSSSVFSVNVARGLRAPWLINIAQYRRTVQNGWSGTSQSRMEELIAGGYADSKGYLITRPDDWSDTIRYIFDMPGAQYNDDWVLTYDGTDAATLFTSGGATVTSNVVGQIEFTGPGAAGGGLVALQFSSINAANHPRNFKLIRASDQAAYDAGQRFRADFLQDMQGISAIRAMDLMEINGNTTEVWPQVNHGWDNFFPTPFSALVDLANASKCDLWVQVPGLSVTASGLGVIDTTCARQMAKYAKKYLHPDLKFFAGYSNEVWNGNFAIHNVMQKLAIQAGWDILDENDKPTSVRHSYCAKINALCAREMQDVFGEEADSRFSWIFEGGRNQSNWTNELVTGEGWRQLDPQGFIDPATIPGPISVAHYYGSSYIGNSSERASLIAYIQTGATEQEVITYIAGRVAGLDMLDDMIPGLEGNKAVADATGRQMNAYEGGSHINHLFGTGIPASEYNIYWPYLDAYHRSPEGAALYLDSWDIASDYYSGPLMVYMHYGAGSHFGSFYMQSEIGVQTGLSTAIRAYSAATEPWWQDDRRGVSP